MGKTANTQAEQKTFDAGCVMMDAITSLRLCTVAMSDANQSFPYDHGLKCSNGADASIVYFGVCRTLELVADDLTKLWQEL